ncbi:MAG: FAD-dependent oxidoreductase [Anaerolineales bacterium]|nr:FAD-dependent oxidoreductase [Chloroflexota bacterium]MBL6979642.1 FAD-dependent oxidoreductase [Anaerolineales bacterium]
MQNGNNLVAVIGAGPAGLFAAKKLAQAGADVVIFNRDIRPGGLAEYGIYHTKYRMKAGLRRQFLKILSDEKITYYGNVSIGVDGDLSLEEIKKLGFQAIVVAVGAQGTKWLGLPGEDLKGVFHAKDLVYHYNKLPPYSQREFSIGKRVALIGVGNVMIDIAHWLIHDKKVDEVVAVARRGPAEVKFTKKEMENVIRNLDLDALDDEIKRVTERMLVVDQSPEAARDFILSAVSKAKEPNSDTRFTLQFLSSPKQILGDEQGNVCGLEVEDTKLIAREFDTKVHRLGTTRVLDVDTVVFCIGDKVDESLGLPIQWDEFVKHPMPRFPMNELSFEVYDPEVGKTIEGVFVAGWSRAASSGLVGYARKDGESGAEVALKYLEEITPPKDSKAILKSIDEKMGSISHTVIDKTDVQRLIEIEGAQAEALGLEEFKFDTNQEMLESLEE